MATKIDIEDVERLNVAPGDVLLITMPLGATVEECQRVQKAIEGRLPVKAIVKTSGIQVQVVAASEVRTR